MMRTKRSIKIAAKTSRFRLSHPSRHGLHNNKTSKKSDFKSPTFAVESEVWSMGCKYVCGLDEAGRGAWAGPLVTAAVVLPDCIKKFPFRDSKDLKEEEREKMFKMIQKEAVSFSVAVLENTQIDKLGIQTATYICFDRSISDLKVKPDFLLIDYYRLPGSKILQRSIKFGDRISMSIAAASIVAKVTRDKIMKDLSRKKAAKNYSFDRNFGYGTKDHRQRIKEFGISTHHRKTYCRFDSDTQKSFNFL